MSSFPDRLNPGANRNAEQIEFTEHTKYFIIAHIHCLQLLGEASPGTTDWPCEEQQVK